MICTRCESTGFLSIHQVPTFVWNTEDPTTIIHNMLMSGQLEGTDIAICDCCGDGKSWYGTPGEHYTRKDPLGDSGPYSSNRGKAQCH